MEFRRQEIYEILKKKGVVNLFHANTVVTSCTFLSQHGLLSRGAIEGIGLRQTPQKSDLLDKKFEVWNDIFLDSTDLHGLFPRQNLYGPVLFVFDLEMLLDKNIERISITRDNPINWVENQSLNERYIQNVNELDKLYQYGSYKEMITLRECEFLPFGTYIKKIVVDDPNISIDGTDAYTQAIGALEGAANKDKLDIKKVLVKRQCNNCYCRQNYLQMSNDEFCKLFYRDY